MLGSSRHLKSQTRKFFTIFPCSRKLLKCHLGKNEATKSTAKQVLVLEKIKQTFPVLHLFVKSLAVFFYSCLTVTSKRFLRGSNFVTAKHGRDCVQQSSIFWWSISKEAREKRQEILQSKHMSHNFFCLSIFKCHFETVQIVKKCVQGGLC